MKKFLINTLLSMVRTFSSARAANLLDETIIEGSMERVLDVNYQDVQLTFAVPNTLSRYRVETFATKEPETLDWIDIISEGSVLWDIGANIGLYSVYAAKRRNCRVFAFEPSVFNLEILARNLFLNNLQERVTIMPLALSDQLGPNQMRMTTTKWGGALSTFGKDIGWDGHQIRNKFEFPTFGLTMDQAVSLLGLPIPDYIKMDVDGIEHFILLGGPETLNQIKSILVEVNDNFEDQAKRTCHLLEKADLKLIAKNHSELLENSEHGYQFTFNQIWGRP
jgi:FkbM family methyltransferase